MPDIYISKEAAKQSEALDLTSQLSKISQPAKDAYQQLSATFSVPNVESLLAPFGPAPAPPVVQEPAAAPGPAQASVPDLGTLLAPFGEAGGSSAVGSPRQPAGAPSSAPADGAAPSAGATPGTLANVQFSGAVDRPERIRLAMPAALEAERETGIPAEVNLAFGVHESGFEDRYAPGFGYHGIHAQAGEPNTPFKDWRPNAQGGQDFYDSALKAFQNPTEGIKAFSHFLIENPRYAPAIAQYRQTGDKEQLIRDIWAKGYGQSPTGPDETVDILRHQIPAADRSQPTSVAGPSRPTPDPNPEAGLTPNQIDMALSERLDYDTALAVCGPAAAIAFARANGRNPSMREALELAKGVGWTPEAGMAGPQSQVKLMNQMGIASHLEDGVPDWQKVSADVRRGNPVILSTPGHYFVVERVDDQGNLDLGQSASVLKASGGRRWFRPGDIQSLGMGAPRGALYMDNPATPQPSSVAGRYGAAPEEIPPAIESTPAALEAAPPRTPMQTLRDIMYHDTGPNAGRIRQVIERSEPVPVGGT
ncbi:MAG: hypothetical protein ACRDGM_18140 [bacterium]